MATSSAAPKGTTPGCSFLVDHHPANEIFTIEDFSDEHKMILQTTDEFGRNEIVPNNDRIEQKDFALDIELMRKAAELGLIGVDIPEEYGGTAMDKVAGTIIFERFAATNHSFLAIVGAHVSLVILPMVFFGNEEQKKKYLPKLASCEWLAAYGLSEASSGSDPLNCRTRAALSPDGKHYILNGEKMWITNSGFADFFIVFAKVDGEKFTAFLVEKNFPGFTVGAEEHKMGIRGSSTCPLILNDCKVPVENVLGEIGKGHVIAFNTLNFGRLKLGAGCVGAARESMNLAIGYANQRKAFGKPISEYGMIREKLANQAVGVFTGEAMAYRTIGMIEAAVSKVDKNNMHAVREAIEEYAVECSILKIWGSELADYVVDETMQIYAGYGYVEEYPVERHYRDSRIDRIFEGTNEINKLVITGFLLKRNHLGQVALNPAIKSLAQELASGKIVETEFSGPLAAERKLVAQAKKIMQFVTGAALQKYGSKAIFETQEAVAAIADMVMQIYAMDSAVIRAEKIALQHGEKAAALVMAMARVAFTQAMEDLGIIARKVIASTAEGDGLSKQLADLEKLTRYTPFNTIALRQQIAQKVIEAGRYTIGL